MFNKILKLLTINLILFIIIFVIIEFISFQTVLNFYKKVEHHEIKYSLKMSSYDSFYNYFKKNHIRPVENKNNNLNPIIIFGCSYAYGDNLNENQTFSHKLAKYTPRPIYNMSFGGWSVANMLYQIENDDLIQTIKQPKYVIYIYCPFQQHRIYLHVYDPGDNRLSVHYNKKPGNNILRQQKLPPFLFSFYTVKKTDNYIAYLKGYNKHFEKERNQLTILFFKQALKEMQKIWNNNDTKYFILNYSNTPEAFLQTLGKETDWKIINLYDLDNCNDIINNVNYQIAPSDAHPNEKAWDVITPALIKEIEKY